MRRQLDGEDATNTVLTAEESDAAFAAWTLEEIDDFTDLGSVRSAPAGSDDASSRS
jgi:hypothetical protein